MKRLITVLLFLAFCTTTNSFDISAQTFAQSSISDSLRTKIEKVIWGKRNASKHWSVRPLPSFYEHLRNDVDEFILVMLVINQTIDSIILAPPTIAIYGNYPKRFVRGDGHNGMYRQYHDIYSSLFSFKEIDIIQVFDCWNNCRNVTFLPLKSHDYNIAMENAIFRRSWYIPELDYYELLGEDKMEDKKFYNEQWEFLSKELEILIYKYQINNKIPIQ